MNPQQPFMVDAQGRLVVDASGKPQAATSPPPTAPGVVSQLGTATANMAKGAWDYTAGGAIELSKALVAPPKPGGVEYTGRSLVDMVSNDYNVRLGLYKQAKRDLSTNNYGGAVERLAGWMVPFLGPAAVNIVETAKSGRLDEASGQLLGVLAGGAKKVLPADARIPGAMRNKNAIEARAMDTALDAGVPLDLGTASGSRLVKRGQFIGEAGTVAGFKNFEPPMVEGLKKMGTDLVRQVRPGAATTPEQAGGSLGAAMRRVRDVFGRDQQAAYTRLYEIAEQHVESVPIQKMLPGPDGTPTLQTVMVDLAAPVDLRPVKVQLTPIFEQMNALGTYTDTVKASNPGYNAIRNVVNGPDFVSLETAVKNASAISERGVGTEASGLRNIGQGGAAKAGGILKQAIADRLQNLGADTAEAVRVFDDGKTATKRKWATAEEIKQMGLGDVLAGEPVAAFRKLTAPHDTHINLLRRVAKRAPNEPANMGRAWLEDLVSRVTSTGDIDHAVKALNEWKAMGEQTKEILFADPAVRQRVGDFLLVVKKWRDSPNPSGTGAVNVTMRAIQGLMHTAGPYASAAGTVAGGTGVIPYQLVGSILTLAAHNPTVVKLLVQGLTTRASGPVATAGVTGTLGVSSSLSPEVPTLSSPTASPDLTSTPPDVVQQAGPGIHTLSDGSVWRKNTDGSVAKLK